MGAKYLPTIKDQKASQRFQLKQSGLKKLKAVTVRSSKKSGRGK